MYFPPVLLSLQSSQSVEASSSVSSQLLPSRLLGSLCSEAEPGRESPSEDRTLLSCRKEGEGDEVRPLCEGQKAQRAGWVPQIPHQDLGYNLTQSQSKLSRRHRETMPLCMMISVLVRSAETHRGEVVTYRWSRGRSAWPQARSLAEMHRSSPRALERGGQPAPSRTSSQRVKDAVCFWEPSSHGYLFRQLHSGLRS